MPLENNAVTSQKVMHIGLDDTDSTKGGCTTYLAALLIEKLESFKSNLQITQP